jgi:ribose transport system substrate-binding protein
VLVGGFAGDAGSTARLAGFRGAAASLRLRIVSTLSADFDFDKAQAAAARALRNGQAVDGFFAANDVMALGIAQAVGNARRSGVKVIGVDGIADALQAIKAGTMTATVSQYPFVIGQLGVEACLAAVRGRALPARIDAPVQVVTSANVDQAIVNFPRPVAAFADPLAALLER